MFEITSTCRGGGYHYCRTIPAHPRANKMGLYPLHRVVMENKLGRLLEPGEVVHHIDHDKSNNDPSNLEVLTSSEHSKEHWPRWAPIEVACPCGRIFTVRNHSYRQRLRRAKHGTVYCSLECSGRMAKHTSG